MAELNISWQSELSFRVMLCFAVEVCSILSLGFWAGQGPASNSRLRDKQLLTSAQSLWRLQISGSLPTS